MGASVPAGAAWGQPLHPAPHGSSPHPAPLPFSLPAQVFSLAGESSLPVANPVVPRHPRWPWQAGIPCHPTGTQTSQLISDPPWTPVFLLEKVKLTCRGSGMPGPTEWYLNEQLWQRTRSDYIYVSKKHPGNNSYQCRSPEARLSPPVTLSFSNGEEQDGCPHPGTCGCPEGSGWALFHSLLPLVRQEPIPMHTGVSMCTPLYPCASPGCIPMHPSASPCTLGASPCTTGTSLVHHWAHPRAHQHIPVHTGASLCMPAHPCAHQCIPVHTGCILVHTGASPCNGSPPAASPCTGSLLQTGWCCRCRCGRWWRGTSCCCAAGAGRTVGSPRCSSCVSRRCWGGPPGGPSCSCPPCSCTTVGATAARPK